MSAGLVSAVGAAIHTAQVQVDEVTVMGLAPVVYKESGDSYWTGWCPPRPRHRRQGAKETQSFSKRAEKVPERVHRWRGGVIEPQVTQ